jgi:hypothetical protein
LILDVLFSQEIIKHQALSIEESELTCYEIQTELTHRSMRNRYCASNKLRISAFNIFSVNLKFYVSVRH